MWCSNDYIYGPRFPIAVVSQIQWPVSLDRFRGYMGISDVRFSSKRASTATACPSSVVDANLIRTLINVFPADAPAIPTTSTSDFFLLQQRFPLFCPLPYQTGYFAVILARCRYGSSWRMQQQRMVRSFAHATVHVARTIATPDGLTS